MKTMVGQIVHMCNWDNQKENTCEKFGIASLNVDAKTKQNTIYCIIRTKIIYLIVILKATIVGL